MIKGGRQETSQVGPSQVRSSQADPNQANLVKSGQVGTGRDEVRSSVIDFVSVVLWCLLLSGRR
jgi:hypothetical protein